MRASELIAALSDLRLSLVLIDMFNSKVQKTQYIF